MDGAFNGYYKMPLHSESFVFRRHSNNKYLYVFMCVAKQEKHVFKSDLKKWLNCIHRVGLELIVHVQVIRKQGTFTTEKSTNDF